LLVFFGAKGGAGVTAVACNFAVAMAQEAASETTLLIDLDLPLGDAALNLGIVAQYSTIDALQNFNRLDSSFLSKLLNKHSSGVSVLAAPGKFTPFDASNEAIDKLLTIARQDFDNVVVDVGSKPDFTDTALFEDATTIYLVTQAGIPELRNSNRLISQYFNAGGPKLEVVLNRYESRGMGVSEDNVEKALTRPAKWKVPNDYAAVRRMQNTATPLTDSPISWLIGQMARSACGLPEAPQKKKGFFLKSLSRGFSAKNTAPDETLSITRLRLTPGPDENGNSQDPGSRNDSYAEQDSARREAAQSEEIDRRGEPETRTYNGNTYMKGADGRWYLQDAEAQLLSEETPSIEWSAPSTIEYGDVLTSEQLNAVASGPGRFIYTPSEGYVLQAGTHTLWVTFIPAGTAGEVTAQASVTLTVNKATPTITWSTPEAIPYGTVLDADQLNATASVPGTFTYTPGEGDLLAEGMHALSVLFTPTDSTDYTTAQADVLLTVTKPTPSITWPPPPAIVYGTALSTAQLNARASVPGTYTYTPAASEELSAGSHTLSVLFTPTDTADYTTAQSTVTLTVNKATPTISWSAPPSIPYGSPLNASQLKASASVPGTFAYTPGEGSVLPAGRHALSVTFTPTDSVNYTTVQGDVSVTVTKAAPAINWSAPPPISYGTALSATQLNATASVPGRFAYIPGVGAVLAAGRHTPSVTFIPKDTTNFTPAQAAVQLIVTKATPAITWPAPSAIAYGTALGATQLNAIASVSGAFSYTPGDGTVLTEGTQTLFVTFTPTDATNYNPAQAAVSLMVTKATPTTITWPTPPVISYGTGLSSAQLNATATVPGVFAYAPGEGEVLAAGRHSLSVTFTPTDTNFPQAQATVSLIVTKARPTITWDTPSPIIYGYGLSASELDAVASVAGSFSYSPSLGTILPAGKQTLSATFSPADTTNYTTGQADVALIVTKATPMVTWTVPSSIPYGTPLSSAELNATASIPGAFAYAPGVGTVLTPGTQVLSVTFAPADSGDYTAAQATVEIEVEGLPDLASLSAELDSEDGGDAFQPIQTYGADAGNFYQPQPSSSIEDGDPFQPARLYRQDEDASESIQVTPLEPQRWPEAQVETASAPISTPVPVETKASYTVAVSAEYTDHSDTKPGALQIASAPSQQTKVETRTYKGAVYEKGADGQWHLQQK
jgi:MinD-like ATPase involved in chromosome partitioning or flagellar assembly